MRILSATTSDLSEIIQWITSKDECRTWAGSLVTYPILIDQIVEEINFDPKTSCVCKSKGNILAFGQFFHKEDYIHLARIITNPYYRGAGFGREICTQLIEMASQLGDNGFSLNVYRNNIPAKNLYISLGFCEQASRSTNETIFMVKT